MMWPFRNYRLSRVWDGYSPHNECPCDVTLLQVAQAVSVSDQSLAFLG